MSLTSDPLILQDAFLYFAKFPNHDKVMELFTRRDTDSPFPTESAALRTLLTDLSENSLVSDLEAYVFAPNEDAIKKQIEDIGDKAFMFLDYGQFNSEQNNVKVKTDFLDIGITIARKYAPNNLNAIEAVIFSDLLLNMMRLVRSTMLTDQICHPFAKRLTFSHTIVPFFAKEWSNATGWSLMTRMSGIDLL
jgi:hypothetical protein